MNLKSLPIKITNGTKADFIAIYSAMDIASGGSLSLIKESIIKSYQGFMDAKFNNLILDLAHNNITTDEFVEFINCHSHSDREFMSNLIIKSLHADNRITTFLLALLSTNKIKNGSLNYYESSLFTNINTFTYEDFEIFYTIFKNSLLKNVENQYEFQSDETNEYYVTVLEKFKNIGILQQSTNLVVPSNYPVSTFSKTSYSDTFFKILNDFFMHSQST